MASKNGSKPRSNDEDDTAYFLRGAGGFFAEDDLAAEDLAEEDLEEDLAADDLVAGADGRGADRVLRGRVVPCERLPR
jgi:hypothetical protein